MVKRSAKSRAKAKEYAELTGYVRQIRLARDENKCVFCGSTKQLQLMHLLSVGAHPRLRFDPFNTRIGCYACHLGTRGWHKDSAPYWAKLPPGLLEQLEIMSRMAPKIDVALLRIILQAEVAAL